MVNTHTSKRVTWKVVALALILAAMTAVTLNQHFAQAAGDHNSKLRGIIQDRPSPGRIGAWKIGGRTFDVTVHTRIEFDNGPLVVGSCAEVEYKEMGDVDKALRIERKNANKCDNPNSTIPTPTPRPTEAPACKEDDVNASQNGKGKDCKTVGRLTDFPDQGFVGTWGIDNISYTVNLDTELHTRRGMFVLDACVKAEYRQVDLDRIVKELETTHAYRCDGEPDNQGRHGGEMYGIIESFPLSATGTLMGEWKIGGITFIADGNTEFKQSKAEFAKGVVVKVKFWTDVNGVHYAQKIETKFKREHHGDDDDHNGSHDGAEGMAAGKVITAPENGVGIWVIGGIEYTADNKTKIEEQHGTVVVGTFVRVRYHLGANGERIADNIKTLALPGNPGSDEDARLVGAVEVMPSDGLSGTWKIANVTFVTDENTRFEEERGVLAVGAYVRVGYVVVDGVNVIVELKTLVPPGAGDMNHTGKIEQSDDGLSAASVTATNVWVIGGKSYAITDGTLLDSDAGALDVGSTVVVNSYTAADGSEVATLVQSVELNNTVYLPAISR